jgi:hypothetical protein
MQANLRKDFKYPLEEQAKRILEDSAQTGYKREVRKLTVPEIRVTDDALVLQLDFELTVK